jgi:hypothetical protein
MLPKSFPEPIRRASETLHNYGLLETLGRIIDFVGPQIFHAGNYHVYEHRLRAREESDFRPEIAGLRCEFVTSNLEADKLEAEGLEFRSHFLYSRSKLESGGIAVCLFVEKNVSCISWIALNKRAEKSFVHRGYNVDYSNGECSTGGAFTLPEFRGRGLMTYNKFKQFQFLYEKGISTVRCAVLGRHVDQRKINEKFAPSGHKEATYFKILFFSFYREKQADPG